eukprot:CAMPEP_0114446406 /NCGR_PEP_ID=MMETSP0103-20121206/19191_1 /TAXON_ID=37642 ORGANISM="Paraphysomonas imperforata, Strain PA2" /NCGR_SAMPLE_ID=MMETSP0103 /ASSEMBLY_ACC=CAM_ASM_000201 /LENGTH=428 /DNA_ID=CAMNT_0001618185 /DNA_START=86 /DNA_END=1372 /DNA_ORIENTATION=+
MTLLSMMVALLCMTSTISGYNSKSNSRRVGSKLFSTNRGGKVLPSRFATNSSAAKLNTSKLCDVTRLDGHWVYGANESTEAGACYSKADEIFGYDAKAERRSMDSYGCSSYQSAEFVTPSCLMLSLTESFNKFVGDSLMLQQYVAAQCYLSEVTSKTPSASRPSFHMLFDAFLRPNIPCFAACLQNSSFRLSVRKKFPDPCSGCPEGKPVSSTPPHHSSYGQGAPVGEHSSTVSASVVAGSPITKSVRSQWWMQKLPPDTRVLVIGTGAWYNSFQGMEQGSEEYGKTLFLLRPIFRHLIDEGVMIIWLALPPMVDDLSFAKAGEYGWDSFRANNARAFQSFREMGVLFLDLGLMMYERKIYDPRSSADGLHWCNLGRTSMPSIINQMIFHLAAVTIEEAQVSTKRTTITTHQRPGVNKHRASPNLKLL